MPDPTQGSAAPGAAQGEGDAPKALTHDEANRIFTARARDQEKKFEKWLGDFAAAQEKRYAEFAEKLNTAPAAPTATGGEQKQLAPHETPEWRGMQKQLAELKAQTEAANARAAAEAAKARDVALRQRLAEELQKHGVDAKRVKHAIGYLVDAERAVKFDGETDDIVFGNDAIDLASGVKSWVSSDEGKFYLPPSGASGSGDRPRQGGRNQPVDQGQSAHDLGTMLIEQFGTGIGVPLG